MKTVLMRDMSGESFLTAERGGKKVKSLRERIFLALVAASFASIFLPWFSFDIQLTGCQWGVQFLFPMIIPFALIVIGQAALTERSALSIALMELSLLAVPALMVYEMSHWHVMFITGEPSLQTGLHTALPTFWIALGLSLASFLAFQPYLLEKLGKRRDAEQF